MYLSTFTKAICLSAIILTTVSFWALNSKETNIKIFKEVDSNSEDEVIIKNNYPGLSKENIKALARTATQTNLETSSTIVLDNCDGCPEITISSLQGILGYPQVNEVSLCGAADTISVLAFNAGECPISNVILTINFDPGLAYGGFVQEQNGLPISEFNVSDLNNPQFLITSLDSAAVYILNFGVMADCDINPTSLAPLNFDLNYEFSYNDINSGPQVCSGIETEVGNYNNGVRVPVLNIISVSPTTRTISASNTNGCHRITIRQDGIGAELTNFNFDVCGYDPNYSVSTVRTLFPVVPIDFTVDPVAGEISAVVDGPNFMTVGNGDEKFDANESIMVDICYQVEGCLDDPMFLDYKASYGCNGQNCGEPTVMQGAVDFKPDFAANAVATTGSVTYGGICGDNVKFDATIVSSNTDPIDGLWEDCLLYTSPSPRDATLSRMPSSA